MKINSFSTHEQKTHKNVYLLTIGLQTSKLSTPHKMSNIVGTFFYCNFRYQAVGASRRQSSFPLSTTDVTMRSSFNDPYEHVVDVLSAPAGSRPVKLIWHLDDWLRKRAETLASLSAGQCYSVYDVTYACFTLGWNRIDNCNALTNGKFCISRSLKTWQPTCHITHQYICQLCLPKICNVDGNYKKTWLLIHQPIGSLRPRTLISTVNVN